MKKIYQWTTILILMVMLTLTFVPAANAFESRDGGTITIGVDEVINDDLYVTAESLILNGTIKGDLIVFGKYAEINGVVEGDLLGAAQNIIINGEVKDDVRAGAAAIILNEKAKVGSDFIIAAYSVETKKSSLIGGSAVGASAQALYSGEIVKDMKHVASSVSLQGSVGKNVNVEVGSKDDQMPFTPAQFIQDLPPVPTLKPGLTIGDSAKIGGSLTYTGSAVANIPESVISGEVTHLLPKVETDQPSDGTVNTPQAMAVSWVLDNLRLLVTLIILGLLLVWLFPVLIKRPIDSLESQPLPSLGYGVVSYLLFWVATFVLLLAIIIAAVMLGILTLGGLSAAIIFIGLAVLMMLITLFLLVTAYLTKLIVGYWAGHWVLSKIKPDAANNPYWSLIVGVAILVILVAIPFVGWLLSVVITCLGLGSLFLVARAMLRQCKGTGIVTPDIS